MYYAASTFGSNHSGIFLATSTTGASGSWTNQGLVIESNTSDDWNAIDPNLVIDDQGRWWLDFGSFWSGIKMVQLDPATGKRLDGTIRSISGRNGGAIEAPFIYRHGGYYYQFVSFDLCCRGASSTYRIMVGRSTSITGPYVDRNGTAMTSGAARRCWPGTGASTAPATRPCSPTTTETSSSTTGTPTTAPPAWASTSSAGTAPAGPTSTDHGENAKT